METIIQQFIFGITLGATYALVALGFSMQFRAMNLLNFAHGESFMLGAFIGLLCHVFLKLPLFLSWIITMGVCGVAGVIIEFLAIRPLYNAPPLNLFISTIGLSMILRQAANILTGAIAYKFPPTTSETPVKFGQISIVPEQIWVLGMAVLLMFGFEQYLKKTRMGKAMRAVAQAPNTASLMGINVLRMKSLVFALSTMLGGAAGILFAPLYLLHMIWVYGWGLKDLFVQSLEESEAFRGQFWVGLSSDSLNSLIAATFLLLTRM